MNIPNTPDLQNLTTKEKSSLAEKNSSPNTDADSHVISPIQKQTEDDIKVGGKSSLPNVGSPRTSPIQKQKYLIVGDESSLFGAEIFPIRRNKLKMMF